MDNISPDPSSQNQNQNNPGSPAPVTRQQTLREPILATACGGMAIAMSTVLSMISLLKMPQGGSLTPASMLPLVFCALAFGPVWGIGTGAVYGILQFIIDPWAAHWASVVLDYPLAFGLLGLAGFFAANRLKRLNERNILRRVGMIPIGTMILAVVIGMTGRLACHLVSGVVFYAEYAGDQNPWIYSLVYNGSYMLPETVLTCVLMVVLAASLRPARRK